MDNDLISRAAVLGGFNARKVTEYDESGCGMDYMAVPVEAIEAIPAVDAEPVRHGRWIPLWKSLFGIKGFRCSECGYIAKEAGYAYCHCGAKMDK